VTGTWRHTGRQTSENADRIRMMEPNTPE